jgi:hypothetical protein
MKSLFFAVIMLTCTHVLRAEIPPERDMEILESGEQGHIERMLERAVAGRRYGVLHQALLHPTSNIRAIAARLIADIPLADQAPMWRDWLLNEQIWQGVYETVVPKSFSINHSSIQMSMFRGIGPFLKVERTQVPLTPPERLALARRISREILRESDLAIAPGIAKEMELSPLRPWVPQGGIAEPAPSSARWWALSALGASVIISWWWSMKHRFALK